jgi:hypothetical protein
MLPTKSGNSRVVHGIFSLVVSVRYASEVLLHIRDRTSLKGVSV